VTTLALPRPWPTNPWPTRFRTVRASQPGLLPDGLELLTVNSPALGGRGDLALYTPPAAAGHRNVPVVVLLHGVYGSFWNWAFTGGAHLVLDEAIASGDVDPMVLVLPSDGLRGEGTGYLTHPTFDAEGWIVDDVPNCVADRLADRTDMTVAIDRVLLCGNSMGGFGALRLAARHPERCVAAVGLSSITHLDELGQFTVDDNGDAAGVAPGGRGLADLITTSTQMPPFAFDCGTADPLIEANRELHRRLDASGVAHGYDEHDGDHSWAHWPARFAIALRFFQQQVGRPR